MKIKKILCLVAVFMTLSAMAIDHPKATLPVVSGDRFTLVENGKPLPIIVSQSEDKAILHAAANLVEDFERVTGVKPVIAEKIAAFQPLKPFLAF